MFKGTKLPLATRYDAQRTFKAPAEISVKVFFILVTEREVPLPFINYLVYGSTYEVRPVVPVHHLGSCEHGQHAGSQRLQVSGPGHTRGHGGLPSPIKWRAGNASPFRAAHAQLPVAAQPTPPPTTQPHAAIGRCWSRAARLPGRSVGIGGGGEL